MSLGEPHQDAARRRHGKPERGKPDVRVRTCKEIGCTKHVDMTCQGDLFAVPKQASLVAASTFPVVGANS